MTCSSRRILFLAALLTVLWALSGCSWWNKDQGPMESTGYRKMMELQKQKAAAMNKELDVSKKLAEPDAAEMERLGDQYIRQGNMNMAFVYYDKAVRMDPKRSSAHYKMGRLYLSKGMNDEAMAEFEAILKDFPKYALAYEGKGQVALAQGKLDAAMGQFKEAVALNPDLWQAWSFMGIVCDRQKQFKEAIGYYHKAIAINPKSGTLFNNLGMSYFLSGENDKALQAFIAAAKLDPQDKKIHNNMGLALGKLGTVRRGPGGLQEGRRRGIGLQQPRLCLPGAEQIPRGHRGVPESGRTEPEILREGPGEHEVRRGVDEKRGGGGAINQGDRCQADR